MRRLILFRHAKTETRSQAGDDFSRRLTDRGRSEAALMGSVLSEAWYRPDLVLVSPAARAVETWDGMADAFPKARVERRKGLYEATPEEIANHLWAGSVILKGKRSRKRRVLLPFFDRGIRSFLPLANHTTVSVI